MQFARIITFLLVIGSGFSLEPNWSLCDEAFYGNCLMGLSSDHQFEKWDMKSASVRGFWIFFVEGLNYEPTGLGEFLFQERVGDYHWLADEIRGNITFVKGMGMNTDYRHPALTLINQVNLLSNGAIRLSESMGSVDNCMSSNYAQKSLVLNGAERWELFGRNEESVCIQVENTTSFIPGIVRDTRTLGFDHELGNICRVVRGCSKPPSEIITIPNVETSGVLRR